MLTKIIGLMAGDIVYEMRACLPMALLTAVAVCLVYLGGAWWKRDGPFQVDKRRLAVVFILAVYMAALVYITILSRDAGSRDQIDLRPFGTFEKNARRISYLAENILLFLPYGFMLPMVLPAKGRRWSVVLAAVVLSSGAIEITQWFTGRGFCELDDVILNTLGGIIGYGLWLAVAFAVGRIRWRKKEDTGD